METITRKSFPTLKNGSLSLAVVCIPTLAGGVLSSDTSPIVRKTLHFTVSVFGIISTLCGAVLVHVCVSALQLANRNGLLKMVK